MFPPFLNIQYVRVFVNIYDIVHIYALFKLCSVLSLRCGETSGLVK